MASKNTDKPVKKKEEKSGGSEGSKFQLSQVKPFVADVKAEFGKIAWPNKKHTIGSTVVVTIFVIMVSFYLGAVYLLLGKIVGSVLR